MRTKRMNETTSTVHFLVHKNKPERRKKRKCGSQSVNGKMENASEDTGRDLTAKPQQHLLDCRRKLNLGAVLWLELQHQIP